MEDLERKIIDVRLCLEYDINPSGSLARAKEWFSNIDSIYKSYLHRLAETNCLRAEDVKYKCWKDYVRFQNEMK